MVLRASGGNGVNKAGDTMTGPLLQADGTTSAPSYSFSSSAGTGVSNSSGTLVFSAAANASVQRNGTNAQSFKVANTYTDASNYEYGFLDWGSFANIFTVGTTAAGTGQNRNLRLYAGGSSIDFWTAAASRITVNATSLFSSTNGAIALGSAAGSWKQLYIDYTNTGTVGAVTINKAAGRVNIAAAGTSVVVTNSLVTAASHVSAWASTNDATARVTAVVPAAGSFTIFTAATTAQTSFDFQLFNAD